MYFLNVYIGGITGAIYLLGLFSILLGSVLLSKDKDESTDYKICIWLTVLIIFVIISSWHWLSDDYRIIMISFISSIVLGLFSGVILERISYNRNNLTLKPSTKKEYSMSWYKLLFNKNKSGNTCLEICILLTFFILSSLGARLLWLSPDNKFIVESCLLTIISVVLLGIVFEKFFNGQIRKENPELTVNIDISILLLLYFIFLIIHGFNPSEYYNILSYLMILLIKRRYCFFEDPPKIPIFTACLVLILLNVIFSYSLLSSGKLTHVFIHSFFAVGVTIIYLEPSSKWRRNEKSQTKKINT